MAKSTTTTEHDFLGIKTNLSNPSSSNLPDKDKLNNLISNRSISPSSSSSYYAPMTIFFNGKVSVFHLPPQVANAFIRMLESSSVVAKEEEGAQVGGAKLGFQQQKLDLADMQIARKQSLKRFLERRKGRLSASAPYPC